MSATALALPATLLQAQAQSVSDGLVAALLTQMAQGGEAVLDSSALAVVLACRRAVLAQGGQLRVTGLPERAQALAKVYGVSELLN